MPKRELIREEATAPSVHSLDAARQTRALDTLTREHGAFLRGLARKLCRSQLDPDDLVQDVLEKLLRAPPPAGANLRAWTARVMQNLFIDKLRRQHARPEQASDAVLEARPLEQPVWWENLSEHDIRAKLAQVPKEQRATFELFAFHGKTYDEIAAEQGIAKATVGTRILRARQKLRDLLTGERGDG